MFLLTTAFLFAGAFSQVTKDCGAGKTLFTINRIAVSPDVPIKNENFTVFLDYTVPDGTTVLSGTAKYSFTYNFIPITPTIEDICKDTTCPITPGPKSQSSTSTFPDISGTLVTKTQWYDINQKELLCYSLTLKV